MVRLATLILILCCLAVLINFSIGNISEVFKESPEESNSENEISPDLDYRTGPRINRDLDESKNHDQFDEERDSVKIPKIEVLKGSDDDSYFVSFVEVKDQNATSSEGKQIDTLQNDRIERSFQIDKLKPYQRQFISNMKTLGKRFRRQNNRKTRSNKWDDKISVEDNARNFDHDIKLNALKANEIVSSVFRDTGKVRKGLGVCRKLDPKNFVSMAETNETVNIIEDIIKDLKYSLQQTMGCRGCLQPHPELFAFLNWLIKDDVSAKCCVSKPKQSDGEYMLFNHKLNAQPVGCNETTKNLECGAPSAATDKSRKDFSSKDYQTGNPSTKEPNVKKPRKQTMKYKARLVDDRRMDPNRFQYWRLPMEQDYAPNDGQMEQISL